MSKFLDFIEISDSGKTKVWKVTNKSGNGLGKIGWYASWRRYVFYPFAATLWDYDCLIDVANFIKKQMLQRKIDKQNSNQ